VQTGTVIVHTDPHTEMSIHWEAIHFQNPQRSSSCYFFDSYSRPPHIPSILDFIQSGNITERNSKDLPLQSVANIAASSLYTWIGSTPRNNLWGCLLLTTRTKGSTSYFARNLALRCANVVQEGNVVPPHIKGESLTLIVSFCI